MYPINGYESEGYYVSRLGVVGKMVREIGDGSLEYDFEHLEPYLFKGLLCVTLTKGNENIIAPIAKLNLNSIYGNLPFMIKYVDENPLNVAADNLLYEFDKVEVKEEGIIMNGQQISGPVMIISNKKGRCEVFKPIPKSYIYTHNRYWISNSGTVYDRKHAHFVSRSNDNKRYYKVGLYSSDNLVDGKVIRGIPITAKIHTLVYVSWSGDENLRGWTIDHKDCNRHNNYIGNLEKVSLKENIKRMHDRNIGFGGYKCARWTDDGAKLACQMIEKRDDIADISKALGYSTDRSSKEYKAVANLVYHLIRGSTFSDISKRYNLPKLKSYERYQYTAAPPQKYDLDEVRKICEAFVSGKTYAEVCRMFPHIHKATINNIKLGKQYRNISDTIPGMDEVFKNKVYRSKPEMKPQSWDRSQLELICEMIKNEKSSQDIAEALGFTRIPNDYNKRRISQVISGLISRRIHLDLAEKYNLPKTRAMELGFPNSGRFLKNQIPWNKKDK